MPVGAGLLGEFEGTVLGHRDGHGFVRRDDTEPDIYLAPQEMRTVLHRDRVRVRIVRMDRKGRPEGRVLEIIERRKSPIIGRLLHENGIWLVAPEDRRYGQDILIPKNAIANAAVGQVVAIELTETPSTYSQPVGRVIEVLGEIDDPGMEIEIAVRKFEVPHRFSAQALAQAAALPDRVRSVDQRHRIDLTDVPLVTIDGEDARDFDDAVYCEPIRLGKGKASQLGWRLVVAIADVSHYVKPGEALDHDAYERATSVYFPRRVIPMLPEKISNGLCSLKPDENRLCMACDMVVNALGEIEAYQFFPALMRSHARLTYTEVAAVLANTRGVEAIRRAALLPHLLNLHEVYRALLKQRAQRGAIDFETTETQIICDDNGRIERIVPRTRTEAHRLIEEAMLAANVCAADFIQSNRHAALFRVHEGPTPEKRISLQAYLRTLGLGFSLSDEPTPSELQVIASATKDRPDAPQIHSMLLRAMQQAIYTATNNGHFGLAYPAYTHFTSPIRRYPDLLVHRVIKALLAGKRYVVATPDIDSAVPPPVTKKVAKGQAKPAAANAEIERWELAGAHCSANERRADEASRDVEAWLKCRFMRDHLGEEYSGTVRSVTNFGVFVTLDALYVEGLVHITELGGEYFHFDEARGELRGEQSGVRYAIGSRVRIQVSRVDLDGRKIDFRMIPDAVMDPAVSRPRKGKSVSTELLEVKAKDRVTKAARAKAIASRSKGGKSTGKSASRSNGNAHGSGKSAHGRKAR